MCRYKFLSSQNNTQVNITVYDTTTGNEVTSESESFVLQIGIEKLKNYKRGTMAVVKSDHGKKLTGQDNYIFKMNAHIYLKFFHESPKI